MFTVSLSRLLLNTFKGWSQAMPGEPLDLEFILGQAGIAALARERLVQDAERWGADCILWLDADQTFPSDTLLRLVAHRLPIVGANYARRSEEAGPTAAELADGRLLPLYTTHDKVAARLVEPVHQMGLGVTLISMEVFRALERPIFDAIREDHAFYDKARAAGYTPMVDHSLSAEVGHVWTTVLTNEHSLAGKARREKVIELPVGKGVITGKLPRRGDQGRGD
ncbi:MAG: hypothetical protein JWP15_2643 [Alphaproteobacteria bacterium]|nr:hypothetical protein [Alphaproteobacteria bacterium]